MINSLSGGTGSGVGDKISTELEEFDLHRVNVMPYLEEATINETYNTIFSFVHQLNHTLCNINFENKKLFDILQGMGHNDPTFDDVNNAICHQIMNFSGVLQDSSSCSNMQNLDNLVPFRDIKSLIPSFSLSKSEKTIEEITKDVFDINNQMISLKDEDTTYYSWNLSYYNDISWSEVKKTLENEWKWYLNDQNVFPCRINLNLFKHPSVEYLFLDDSTSYRYNCVMLSNSKTFQQVVKKLIKSLLRFYAKRAYVFNYWCAGVEEGEFTEALTALESLTDTYDEISVNIA
jgi:hypothetical protein